MRGLTLFAIFSISDLRTQIANITLNYKALHHRVFVHIMRLHRFTAWP